MGGAGICEFAVCPEAPRHPYAIDVVLQGSLDIVVAIADHNYMVTRIDSEFIERKLDHVGLGATAGTDLDGGSGLNAEVLGETEVLDDSDRCDLWFRGGYCQCVLVVAEIDQHLGYTGIDVVLVESDVFVTLSIRVDHPFEFALRDPEYRQGFFEGRADQRPDLVV